MHLSCFPRPALITAGGKRVWVKTIGEAVKDRAGKIVKVQGAFQDITDSKQMKDMLQDSKELFALFMRYSPVYAYIKEVTPTESRVLQASDNYEQMIGIPGQKMIGRSMVELFPPEFAQKITDDDWAVVSLGNVLQLDEDFNGRHYTSIKFPIRQKSKTLLAGYTIDITDRKRTEEALRERDIRFKKLSFHVPGMIYQFMRRHDGTYCVPFSTEAIKDIFGCSPEDVREDFSPITRVVFPEDLNKLIDSIEASAEHMTTWQCEYRVQIPGQPIRWMFGLSTPENLADGSIIWHGFNMEITDSKQAEEAIQNSETRFREMFEGAPIGYHELDNEGRVARVNRTELAILGYSAEEMLGRHVWEFVHEKDIARKAVLNKLAGILPPEENLERYYCKKDGTRIPVLIQDLIIRDKDGKITGIRTTLQDITNRKLADKQLQDTLKSLRKAVGTTIQVMVSAVETRDPYTAGHQIRSAELARTIATEMGLPLEKIDGIRMAGSIHDIGKLSIPAEILSKPTKLSEIEFSLIKEHARQGYEILKDVESPWPLAEIVYQHHERMDGSGYPRKLKGEEICLEARILAVADVVEAMASHRPYRPGLGVNAALDEIEKNRGTIYDKTVADACLRLFREKGFKLAEA